MSEPLTEEAVERLRGLGIALRLSAYENKPLTILPAVARKHHEAFTALLAHHSVSADAGQGAPPAALAGEDQRRIGAAQGRDSADATAREPEDAGE